MKKQKILVVYYSRTGKTQRVGLEIANKLGADKEDIADMKDRRRIIVGWLISGKDASLQKTTKIQYKKDPSKYDLVVIGTPVWAWTIPPAIRTYLADNEFKKVAFFATCGSQIGKTFAEMEKLSKKPVATMSLSEGDIKKNKIKDEINKFCEELK